MKKGITNLVLLLLSGITFGNAFGQATVASNLLTGSEFIGSSNSYHLDFRTNNSLQMRLTTAGNLGMGTLTPDSKLHIHGGILKLTGPNGAGGPQMILGGTPITGPAPYGEWGIEYTTSVVGREGLNFWKPYMSSGSGASGNYFLFLANSGRVGINTNNPTAQLTVNGKMLVGNPATVSLPGDYNLYVDVGILTKKLKVAIPGTANWADYVFEDNYHLPALSEVKTFIQSNKHLPGVPSAAEMVQNGLDVAEMDAKLLEKIEELTLYIIQLQEQVNELKAEKNTGN